MTDTKWREVPNPPRTRPRGPAHTAILRLLVPLGVAAVVWLIGLTIAAIAVVVATAVVGVLGFVRPTAAARIERLMARIGSWVGRALGLVLLGFVNVVVFAPVSFLVWLFRYDPLSPGVHADAPSFWYAHDARALPRRQFADERALFRRVGSVSAPRRPVLRLATAVGVVALLMLGDLGAGWLYDEVSDASHGTAAFADDTFDPAAQPAFRDAPWAAEMFAEAGFEHTIVYDSYLGYRMGDFSRRYQNVSGGVRVSYEPRVSGRKLSVWFFGGSALYGYGQRDDHTIPSEFARIAEARGIPVEVRNYGRPAVSMWQELELFEQVVSEQDKPDLVVFYDGFNDLAWQMNVGLSATPVNIFDSTTSPDAAQAAAAELNATSKRKVQAAKPSDPTTSTGFDAVVDAYWDQSASRRVYDAVDELLNGSSRPAPRFATGIARGGDGASTATVDHSKQAARNAIAIQERAANLAQGIAAGVGADAALFWQPSVFTKKLLTDEAAYLQFPTYEPARWDVAIRTARQLLKKTDIVDLGNVFDSSPAPVLWDFVHTNEAGAHLAAEAMFSHLEAKLRHKLDDSATR